MLLDKVGKEKDECRDLNSQLKHCINDLKISTCTMKETLISYSCWNEIAENQTKNLILLLSENNANWILSLVGCLELMWRHWLGRNGILKVGFGTCGRPWWTWRHWAPIFWWVFLWKRLLLCIDSATWTSSRLTWLQPSLSNQQWVSSMAPFPSVIN